MHDIMNRIREKKKDDGFTLIELLVVVVIIGVLVAIAVPVYLNYREGAADKSAQSDVRGAISAVEQYYTNNGNTYPAPLLNQAATFPLPAQALGTAGTITLSASTTLSLVSSTTTSTYKICAKNSGGTKNKYYMYDSATGGSVSSVTSASTTYLTACS
jgi:type IV pilus assembly protein PilA